MRRKLILAGALVASLVATSAATADDVVPGIFALAGAEQTVNAEMTVNLTGPLSASLALKYTVVETGDPVREFTEELTQELHLLAINSSLRTLIHEHVKSADATGRFKAEFTFPAPGLYHIYADAVPDGHAQQVLRFDVTIGGAQLVTKGDQMTRVQEVVTIASEPYEVTVDATQLIAAKESPIEVAIMKSGVPADDLSPYLGVPLHAVLIRLDDLSYVHAHPVDPEGGHGDHGMEHGGVPSGNDDDDAAPGSLGEPVGPQMLLRLTLPGSGSYSLFLEFIGNGDIHTVQLPVQVSSGHGH
jgi:hypothetical protein